VFLYQNKNSSFSMFFLPGITLIKLELFKKHKVISINPKIHPKINKIISSFILVSEDSWTTYESRVSFI